MRDRHILRAAERPRKEDGRSIPELQYVVTFGWDGVVTVILQIALGYRRPVPAYTETCI